MENVCLWQLLIHTLLAQCSEQKAKSQHPPIAKLLQGICPAVNLSTLLCLFLSATSFNGIEVAVCLVALTVRWKVTETLSQLHSKSGLNLIHFRKWEQGIWCKQNIIPETCSPKDTSETTEDIMWQWTTVCGFTVYGLLCRDCLWGSFRSQIIC